VDEKTAIQALDRKDPVLPLSPDAPSGTALSTFGTARCLCTRRSTPRPARCSARRRATHVCGVRRVPGDIVVNQPRGKEIHVIADNLSAPKTGQVDDFLDRHPKFICTSLRPIPPG